jgi:hypothetical protein
MSARTLFHGRLAAMCLALAGLIGCEGGGGEPRPETGGAGIPGVRGPAAPNMPKGGAGKGRPAGQGPAARRAAPAPAPAPKEAEGGTPPAAP